MGNKSQQILRISRRLLKSTNQSTIMYLMLNRTIGAAISYRMFARWVFAVSYYFIFGIRRAIIAD